MTKIEKLKLTVDSQNFYHEQSTELEKKIDEGVRYITGTDHLEWEKHKIEGILDTCHKLMIVSSKFVNEAETILDKLTDLTREEYESDVELIAEIALTTRTTMRKQKEIYEKLIELQVILIEIIERF